MKIIEVDEELYQYIASQTQSIGESASDILRRLLNLSSSGISRNFSDSVSANETDEGVSNSKSAVENPPVFVTKQHNEQDEFDDEPVKVMTRKQPEAAIQQIVTRVRQLLNSDDFRQENKAVIRFLNILTVLYRTNPESFAQATEQETSQGRTRTYFARDEATLLAAGNHTKPKQIPDTPYWVITNTNSGRKMLMLERAMQSMHLPEDLIDEVRCCFVAN
ncbi:MAG TPA: replication initiation negative regulator SeqA [Pasteurellaceae bacterium]|nr:replication initiation negative regulator SeqA [Pasteurellaceae bacterium]